MPIIGEYFRRFTGTPQYSPTFPRGGNAALFSVEVFAADAGTSLDAVFEHKNVEDTAWTTLASLTAMTSGVNSVTAVAVKEQIRIAYTVNGASASASVYANTLAPTWRPY